MVRKYVLNLRGEPVECEDMVTWAVWFENVDNRRLAETWVPPHYKVSTVFLGIAIGFGARPVLWETGVFRDGTIGEVRRYATRAAALAGHAEIVAGLREDQTRRQSN